MPSDQRSLVPHARALGVLLRSIIVEREPIYRQQETVTGFAAGMFGSVGAYRPSSVSEIVRRIEDLVAVRVLDWAEDLKAHLGERRADDADILERIFERADLVA